jgi:hypothetical protein
MMAPAICQLPFSSMDGNHAKTSQFVGPVFNRPAMSREYQEDIAGVNSL